MELSDLYNIQHILRDRDRSNTPRPSLAQLKGQERYDPSESTTNLGYAMNQYFVDGYVNTSEMEFN